MPHFCCLVKLSHALRGSKHSKHSTLGHQRGSHPNVCTLHTACPISPAHTNNLALSSVLRCHSPCLRLPASACRLCSAAGVLS